MENLGSKYRIIQPIGEGGTSDVYIVEEKESKNLYAAKINKNKNGKYYLKKEKEILIYLSTRCHPYIINYIDYGEIPFQHEKKYLILEYASKGELYNYIYYPSDLFNELYSKLIFQKILKDVKSFHDEKVCHRDLKCDNIILNDNFYPLICDFGFSFHFDDKNIKGKFKRKLGHKKYMPPQMFIGEPYNGFKADIFSLGVTLFYLTTKNYAFETSEKEDKNYNYIINKEYKPFWENIENVITNNLSKEFKNLFLKMISFNEKERPNIDEILNDDWFKDIRNLDKNRIKELENELKNEFLKREKIIEKECKKEKEINEERFIFTSNRDSSELKEIYFNDNLSPGYIDSDSINIMENYIKIKGHLEGYNFMNWAVNNIKKRLDEEEEEVTIEPNDKKLEFDIFIENQEEEQEEQEEEEEKEEQEEQEEKNENVEEKDELIIEEEKYIYPNDIIIQIELYRSEKNEHFLRFLRKSGDLEKYNEILKIITDEVMKLL